MVGLAFTSCVLLGRLVGRFFFFGVCGSVV